ncbi:MAG: hypothetical protein AUH85_10840 [Chloroflexi bacterium 13_1_40CM_4_68_4]|nr:MAG: hypothetical protein AUH85_10840 [Chloroflexi bacterium 13_1_40CM_4_68_4]
MSLEFHSDATIECACGLPLFPISRAGADVRYECANRHVRLVPMPADPGLRRAIANWIDKRSQQIEEQHRRWERERED